MEDVQQNKLQMRNVRPSSYYWNWVKPNFTFYELLILLINLSNQQEHDCITWNNVSATQIHCHVIESIGQDHLSGQWVCEKQQLGNNNDNNNKK